MWIKWRSNKLDKWKFYENLDPKITGDHAIQRMLAGLANLKVVAKGSEDDSAFVNPEDIEFKRVDSPSRRWILRKISNAAEAAAEAEDDMKRFKKLLKKHDKERG